MNISDFSGHSGGQGVNTVLYILVTAVAQVKISPLTRIQLIYHAPRSDLVVSLGNHSDSNNRTSQLLGKKPGHGNVITEREHFSKCHNVISLP